MRSPGARQKEKCIMKTRYAVNVLAGLSAGSLLACEKSPAERQEDLAQQQAELHEEQAELQEELREQTQEARYADAVPSVVPTRVVTTGLEATIVQQIAEARCAREQKCGNVGADEDYATAEVCLQQITKEWAEEVNAYDCPGGVLQKMLNQCLESIKSEDCASPFDTLGRVVACGSGEICVASD
jgi:hypothetical protein